MSEKGANIDLLFRNGLKDYEVLPPAGVWDGIKNSGKVKSRPFPLLRVAAAIAVLMTVSFFTYRLSRDISSGTSNSMAALNINQSEPVKFNPVTEKYLPVTEPDQAQIPFEALNEPQTISQDQISNTAESGVSSAPVFHFSQYKSLSLTSGNSVARSFQTPVSVPEKKPVNYNYSDLQYAPVDVIPKPENRWSIAAMASPTYYSKFNSGDDGLSKQLMESEEPMISYSGGVGLAYKISKRFSIQSGLYYSSLGQKLDGINSFGGFSQYSNSKGGSNFEILTSNGTIYADNPDVFLNSDVADRIVTAYTNDVFDPKKASLDYINSSLTQSLSYLELPVIVRYKIVDKTIGINLIGGMSYNFLVSNSVYTEIDGNKYQIGDTKGLNPLTLSSSLGMGMEYNFSKKISLNLEPTFRYYLNPFTVTTGTYIHPYSFGIFSGFSYKF
jgi:hypothetical protein